jgi:hypothetical protein
MVNAHWLFTPVHKPVARVASVEGGWVARRGLGLGGNGRFPSSVGIRWLLTHIAHSFGLGSGRRALGKDLSSPNPREYAGASQGSPFWKGVPGRVTRCRGSPAPLADLPQSPLASPLVQAPSPALLSLWALRRPRPALFRSPPGPHPRLSAASPPPSRRRIRPGAELRPGAAAPSGRPPGSAGLQAEIGSDDTASRVLTPTRLGCALRIGSAQGSGSLGTWEPRSREPGSQEARA